MAPGGSGKSTCGGSLVREGGGDKRHGGEGGGSQHWHAVAQRAVRAGKERRMAGDDRDQNATGGCGVGIGAKGRSSVSVREMGHLGALHVARTSNELSATSQKKEMQNQPHFFQSGMDAAVKNQENR